MIKVFVIGSPRSGTTWFTNLLASLPKVATSHHSVFFAYLSPLLDWNNRKKQVNVSYPKTDGSGNKKIDDISAAFLDQDLQEILQFAGHKYFNSFTNVNADVELVVDKSPENIRILPLLSQSCPEAYFIHIVRDPRAVFLSQKIKSKSLGFQFPTKALDGARLWQSDQAGAAEISSSLRNYKLIKYEDLIENTAEVLSDVLGFLGRGVSSGQIEETVTKNKLEQLHNLESSAVEINLAQQAMKWKSQLSSSEVKTIEYVNKEDMVIHDYQLQFDPKGKPFAMKIQNSKNAFFNSFSRINKFIERKIKILLLGRIEAWKQSKK